MVTVHKLSVLAVDRLSPFQDGEPSFQKLVYTDKDRGAFSLELPANRPISLEIYHGSFSPCALSVRLSQGETLSLRLEVKPQKEESVLLTR